MIHTPGKNTNALTSQQIVPSGPTAPPVTVIEAPPALPAGPDAWFDAPAKDTSQVGMASFEVNPETGLFPDGSAQGPPPPPPTSAPPNPYDWWESPDLTIFNDPERSGDPDNPFFIDNKATGLPTGVSEPDWATAAGLDPASFYSVYSQFQNPEIRDQWIGGMQSAYQARQDTDADMAPVLEDLTRRIDPNFDFITGTQQLSAQQQIAQQYARGLSAAQANAAGRGTAMGGAAMGRNQALQSFADASGMQTQATLDAANVQARSTAVDTLARIMSNRQYEPTDFAPFLELDRLRTRQLEIDAPLLEAIESAETAADEFTWDDVATIMQVSWSPLLGKNQKKDMMLAMARDEIGEGWETHEIYLLFMQVIYPGRFDREGNLLPQWSDMLPGVAA